MIVLLETIKAGLGIALVLGVWLLVQRAFRACFPGPTGDDDALAGRSGCHDCRCETPARRACENNRNRVRGTAPDTN